MKSRSSSNQIAFPNAEAVDAKEATAQRRKTSSPEPLDRQESPPTPQRRTPSPTQVALSTPKSAGVHTMKGAQQEISAALGRGDFKRLLSVLQQVNDGRRLDEVLQTPGPADMHAPYVDIIEQTLPQREHADASRLIRKFGSDLLHASLEAHNLPLFERCCDELKNVLLPLVGKDSARVARAAAKKPQALQMLLKHLPTKDWSSLLTAHNGEAMAYLWRHAVREPPVGPVQPELRALAFGLLLEVFESVPVVALNTLHHAPSVQRHMLPALRNFPHEMRALGALLTQRGGTVPWGNT